MQPDAFSEKEVRFFSLISDFVALALDDRIARAQLDSERTKLSLILDLNNSVVANLKLRDVLQSISPSIRKVMRLDLVSLVLPDKDGQHTRLHALDFPDSKGLVQQDELTPVDGSVAPSRPTDERMRRRTGIELASGSRPTFGGASHC